MNADRGNDELRALLWAMEEGSLSPEGIARIDALVRGEQQLLRQYVEQMRMLSDLRFGVDSGRARDALTRLFDVESVYQACGGMNDEGHVSDEELPADVPPRIAPPIHPPSFSIPGLDPSFFPGGAILCHYLIAALVMGAGVLLAWNWGAPNAGTQVAKNGPALSLAKAERIAAVNGMVDCRFRGAGAGSAGGTPALGPGAPIFPGRRIVLAGGLLEILYESRAEVILQGPVDYTVDSANGGFLAAGRVTVRVVKQRNPLTGKELPPKPAFTIRTPASLVRNLGAETGTKIMGSTEFGVETNGPRISRTCVFRGRVAVELLDGRNSLPAIAVGAGHSAVAERSSPGRQGTMFIDDDRGDPSLFAHRVLVPIGADSNGVNQVAWLKAIGTGRQRRFVAVGSGEDLELPPAEASRAGSGTDVQPGQKHGQDGHTTSPAEGSAGGAGSTSGPLAGITYACHLVFDLGDLSPTTAMLQFWYIAGGRIVAVRVNGQELPRRRPAPIRSERRQPREGGQLIVRGGRGHEVFVRGVNTLDIDVESDAGMSDSESGHMLCIRPEVSAIRAPRGNGP